MNLEGVIQKLYYMIEKYKKYLKKAYENIKDI